MWRCIRKGSETPGRQHTAVATGTGQVHCLKPVSILASSQESRWHLVFREKLKVYKWKPCVLSPRAGKLSCKAGSTQAGLPGQGYLLESHGSSHTLSWIPNFRHPGTEPRVGWGKAVLIWYFTPEFEMYRM